MVDLVTVAAFPDTAEAELARERLELEGIAGVATRILEHVSSFPPDARPPLDATLQEAKRRQQEALRAAVAGRAATWSEVDRKLAAGVLDVLWSVASYERLVVDWQLDRSEATRGITWVIGLVRDAIAAEGGELPLR